MHWIDWLITIIPVAAIIGAALYSRKYIRGIADFLAAGRVAGRYVISVGDLQMGLAVISLVALCEQYYQSGIGVTFWGNVMLPVTIFMSLTGYVLYRYRETKVLSMGQFLEARYNRPLRILAAFIRTVAEMMTNAIGPAVAARFFIYFLGLPQVVNVFGVNIPMLAIVLFTVLLLAMLVIWPGGRIALLITDSIQGLMSYPIFVIFTCFVLSEVSWHADVAPVLFDRVPGESFMNPNDIASLRDFNLFALIVTLIGSILNRGAWIGNDASGAGRTAHEQKMAGILGAWRNGFSFVMLSLIALFLITVMQSNHFTEKATRVRIALVDRVAEETVADEGLRSKICADVRAVSPMKHVIGVDKPFSQKHNADTPYLDTVQSTLSGTPENNGTFQQFRTLYFQMMTPLMLREELPVGVAGLFILLMVMLMLSTDDGRIFNASSTLVQDVVMPFRSRPFQKNEHLLWLRLMSLAVAIFFFMVSMFLSQLDYINMFINIMCSLWLGAAAPIMLGGLYTKWGNTVGAFCALIFGSGTAFAGLFCQRGWAETIYPFLDTHNLVGVCNTILETVSGPFWPYVEWHMDPVKFPINSFEIYFLSMLFGIIGYVAGSLITYRKPYNLERLLHRGIYSDGTEVKDSPWTWRNLYEKLIGITDEYTRGDKIIAWSAFFYSVVYQFVLSFVVVAVWNVFSPWPKEWWSWYFYITIVVAGVLVGVVSTVWFMWGGFIDLKRLFHDLAARVDNPLDNGWVEGNVSRVDAEVDAEIEKRLAEKGDKQP